MKVKKSKIKNCLYCGRDTKAESQICFRCIPNNGMNGGHRNNAQINDSKDRKLLPFSFEEIIFDDFEYMDFYKINVIKSENGNESTKKFLTKMNDRLKR